ncbi:MAG: hypothetical protein QOI61_2166 [Actinomycetota bacterium]|jgi:hypothetical protein
MHLHLDFLMAALSWDPQIRGFLIFITAVAILPGSIYLLLSTNLGARIGFLVAVAGLSGWLMLLAITWAVYGGGIKGRDPSWKVQEVVHSQAQTDLSTGVTTALRDFPGGWKKMPATGSSALADAQAAADAFITKSGRKPKMGHEGPIIKEPTAEQLRFPAEFSESANYVLVGGYEKGGDNCLGPKESCSRVLPKKILFWKISHKFFFRHSAHYVAVAIAPVLPQETPPGGKPPKPVADPSKPVTTVIVLRDLGSIRFPQVMMIISSGLIFAVTCHALHRRDKRIMALRAAGVTPATA